MVTCEYCGEDFNVIFTCRLCGGKFCKNHKNPDDHGCPSKKSDLLEKFDTNIENSIIEDLKSEETLDAQEIEKNESYSSKLVDSDSKGSSSITSSDSTVSRLYKRYLGLLKPGILLATLIISLALSGFLYQGYQDYQDLYYNYQELYNNSLLTQSYYDELTDQYTELREEYTQLNTYYSKNLANYAQLQMEYDDLISYRLHTEIEGAKNITLGPKQNISIVYPIPFSGYIDVYYNASGDTYVWVGSTTLEGFYSRNPHFPGIASEINFTVPVMPDIIIYFANPDEFKTITITYNIIFTY